MEKTIFDEMSEAAEEIVGSMLGYGSEEEVSEDGEGTSNSDADQE